MPLCDIFGPLKEVRTERERPFFVSDRWHVLFDDTIGLSERREMAISLLTTENRKGWLAAVARRAIVRVMGRSGCPLWEEWASKWLAGGATGEESSISTNTMRQGSTAAFYAVQIAIQAEDAIVEECRIENVRGYRKYAEEAQRSAERALRDASLCAQAAGGTEIGETNRQMLDVIAILDPLLRP